METTNALEKLAASTINAAIVFILSTPFLLLWGFGWKWKLATIVIFFLYNLYFLIFHKNRYIGMQIFKTYWAKDYPLSNKLIYIFLYTVSFATLWIWIWFPFDLFLINILLLQLPTVLTTKTTLHGYLSGTMATRKE